MTINDLTVAFEKIPVLRNINMTMEDGKIYSLIGPNGAGKSTLMETCMGFHGYGGDIKLEGRSIKGRKPNEIDISYVPQEHNTYRRLTVHDNIDLARIIKKSTLKMDEIYEIFPILRERQGQKANTLSGGEARQLAIALALVHLKRFVMLDEPLTGLSPKMAANTLGFIKELKQKYDLTILISEQNLEVTEISDEIFVLRSGELGEAFTQAEWSKLSREKITEMVFGRTS